MTYDILISGSGGFIGRALVPALQQTGLKVIRLADWQAIEPHQRPHATNFLHLANIHANPMANVALLQQTLAEVQPFIQRWVQFQSGITLVGLGKPNPVKQNFGITPTCLDAYATGKLLQEALLLRAKLPSLVLCYLTLVEGVDGPWHAVRQQARRHGYSLPQFPAGVYPQLLTREELARQLLPLLKQPPAPGCNRRLFANPIQPASWEAWLGAKRLAPPHLSAPQRLRRLAASGRDRGLALAAALGVLPWVARVLYGPVPNQLPNRQATPTPQVPHGPWHPHGIVAHHLQLAPQVTPQHNPQA